MFYNVFVTGKGDNVVIQNPIRMSERFIGTAIASIEESVKLFRVPATIHLYKMDDEGFLTLVKSVSNGSA